MRSFLYSTALAALVLVPATASAELGQNTNPSNDAWQMEQDELSALEETDREKLNGMMEEQTSGESDLTTRMSEASTREIEQALQDRGFAPGSIDGQWDEETTAALEDFQTEQGLETTGEADENTMSALGIESGSVTGTDMMSDTDMLSEEETTGAGPSYGAESNLNLETNYNE